MAKTKLSKRLKAAIDGFKQPYLLDKPVEVKEIAMHQERMCVSSFCAEGDVYRAEHLQKDMTCKLAENIVDTLCQRNAIHIDKRQFDDGTIHYTAVCEIAFKEGD